jgi:uncharacterized protein (TIGR02266 family)
MMDHKRAHPRFEVKAYVDFAGNDVLLYHSIQNLSLGGICIRTSSPEEVGTVVDVVVNFPELGNQIALTGEVVWANRTPPQDMGIRWVDLDDQRRGLLRDYLHEVKTRELSAAGPAMPPPELAAEPAARAK